MKRVLIQLGDDDTKIIGWVEIDPSRLDEDTVLKPVLSGGKLVGIRLVPAAPKPEGVVREALPLDPALGSLRWVGDQAPGPGEFDNFPKYIIDTAERNGV